MAGTPELEKPPGIPSPWFGIWRATLKQLKAQDTWTLAQRPLLDEYVESLMAAELARRCGAAGEWDKAAKRALAFADALGLTVKGKPAAKKGDKVGKQDDADPFAALDELAVRRGAKARSA